MFTNTCLIEAIELLAQKTYGIRSYANAFPEALDQARRDHIPMIKALHAARRDELIALARHHLKPSQDTEMIASSGRLQGREPPRDKPSRKMLRISLVAFSAANRCTPRIKPGQAFAGKCSGSIGPQMFILTCLVFELLLN